MTIGQEKAWGAACRAWSLDDGKDPEKTGALGERLMYADTDLICALQGEIEGRDVTIGGLEYTGEWSPDPTKP